MNRAWAALRSFGRSWLFRGRMERDMDREMRYHIDVRADDLQRGGLPRAEAERQARAEFGDVVRWKEAGRDARGLRVVDDLGADLRYAVRTIRRTPGFAVAAIVSLALGIGAGTAIFGLLDVLLLKPLPVRDPQSARPRDDGRRARDGADPALRTSHGSSRSPRAPTCSPRRCWPGTTRTRSPSTAGSRSSPASASRRTTSTCSAFRRSSVARSRPAIAPGPARRPWPSSVTDSGSGASRGGRTCWARQSPSISGLTRSSA